MLEYAVRYYNELLNLNHSLTEEQRDAIEEEETTFSELFLQRIKENLEEYIPDFAQNKERIKDLLEECKDDEEEMSEDSFADPITVAIEKMKNEIPQTDINIALIYHFDVGYHYGFETLWMDGDERQCSALLLNFALRQKKFWDEKAWRNSGYDEGYKGLLTIILNLMDVPDESILEIFKDHIPDDDLEQKNKLLKRIEDYLKNKKDYKETSESFSGRDVYFPEPLVNEESDQDDPEPQEDETPVITTEGFSTGNGAVRGMSTYRRRTRNSASHTHRPRRRR